MTDGSGRLGDVARAGRARLASISQGTLIVSGTALIYGTNQTMYRPLIAPYAVSLGAGPFVASLSVAASAVAGLFLAVPAGFAAQRFGEGWLLVIGGVFMSTAGLLAATVPDQAALMMAMLLAGVATVCISLSAHGIATAPVRDGKVDTGRVAAFGVFVMVGQMIGPLAGGVVADLVSYGAAFGTVTLLGLIMAGVGLYVRTLDRAASDRAAADRAAVDTRDVAATPPAETGRHLRRTLAVAAVPGVSVALLLSSLGTLLLSLRNSLLPLYLDQIAWTSSQIGLLLSSSAGIALLFRVFFPAIERRLQASLMFSVALIGSAVGLAGAVASTLVPVIVVSTWVAGAMLGVINPVSLTVLARLVADAQRRLTLGLRISVRNATQLAGPVAFGAIAAAATVRIAFFALTFLSAVASAFGAQRMRRAEGRAVGAAGDTDT